MNAGLDAPPVEEVNLGFPEPGEIYHLEGDGWTFSETRHEERRDTYKNGAVFSDAGRDKGYTVYADHAPLGAPVAAEVKQAGVPDEFPPEFTTFIDSAEEAKTWAEIKLAMAAFYNTGYFKGLPAEQQNQIRANTWETATDHKVQGLPDQASDASAFRLWIETQDDPDAINGTLGVLEREPVFAAKDATFKDAIRRAAAARIEAVG